MSEDFQIRDRQRWLAPYAATGCQSAPIERGWRTYPKWMPHVLGAMSREWMTQREIVAAGQLPDWAVCVCLAVATAMDKTVEEKKPWTRGPKRFRLVTA